MDSCPCAKWPLARPVCQHNCIRKQAQGSPSQQSDQTRQQSTSEAVNCADILISNKRLSAVIICGLSSWFSSRFYCPENTNISVRYEWFVNMNGRPSLPGMYQSRFVCFQGWCHVLCEALMGSVHVSGHQGPFSNQLYKWAWVWRAGEMLSITPRLSGGAAGVCVESPAHTDPYKRLCDVLEQMSRGRLWHMTDSSFDSLGKVCREVSI